MSRHIVDDEPSYRSRCEVSHVDDVRPEDLDLAAAGKYEHRFVGGLVIQPKAEDIAEEPPFPRGSRFAFRARQRACLSCG